MNRETLEDKLSLGEGQNIEFKSGVNPRIIGRVVSAFLNSGGGYLIIGVADNALFSYQHVDI